jgi:hypothetical protein
MTKHIEYKIYHDEVYGWTGNYKVTEFGISGYRYSFTLEYVKVCYGLVPRTLADMIIESGICKSYELDRILVIIGHDDDFISIPGHLIPEFCSPFMGRIVTINGQTIFYENSEVIIIRF